MTRGSGCRSQANDVNPGVRKCLRSIRDSLFTPRFCCCQNKLPRAQTQCSLSILLETACLLCSAAFNPFRGLRFANRKYAVHYAAKIDLHKRLRKARFPNLKLVYVGEGSGLSTEVIQRQNRDVHIASTSGELHSRRERLLCRVSPWRGCVGSIGATDRASLRLCEDSGEAERWSRRELERDSGSSWNSVRNHPGGPRTIQSDLHRTSIR